MDTDEIEQAVEQRRVWLHGQLDGAAARFGVELAGEVVNNFDSARPVPRHATATKTCGCAL